MGGLQSKFPRPSASSTSSNPTQDGRHPSASNFTDSQHLVHPSVARVIENAEQVIPLNERRDFQSLDRSLKAFLRASNLPGLEYRLRLAGYQRLDDLLDTDAEKLSSQGFTKLMSRRLMTSLDNYLRYHLDITEGQPSPFQLVRRGHLGQRIKSDPSDEMKALPNFGKKNMKRSADQVSWRQPRSRKRAARKQHSHSAVVRLMSEEQIPSEPIFPNVIDVRDSVFVREGESGSEEGSERSITTSSSSSSQLVELGRIVEVRQTGSEGGAEEGPAIIPIQVPRSSALFDEYFMDDVDTPSSSDPPTESDHTYPPERVNEDLLPHRVSFVKTAAPSGYKLRAISSIPASYWFASVGGAQPQYPERTYIRVRAYSCPPSLASMATPLEDILSVLTSAQDVESIVSGLRQVVSALDQQKECDCEEMMEAGVLPVLLDLLQTESTSQQVAERVAVLCCKAIKLLTREGTFNS